jgi:CBS domain-containing protein
MSVSSPHPRAEPLTARDVMSSPVITAHPETPVVDLARLLVDHCVSAVPVVDGGRLVGIVSEGDLIRRAETGTERRRSWWLTLVTSPATLAEDYARSHGHSAADVMTPEVVTVTPETSLGEIAAVLEERRIKRVPVVHDGRVVGIVSRADLVRVLAAAPVAETLTVQTTDHAIRAELLRRLEASEWATPGFVNPIVLHGVVRLWGFAQSEADRRALIAAAGSVPGVRAVEDHLRRGDG